MSFSPHFFFETPAPSTAHTHTHLTPLPGACLANTPVTPSPKSAGPKRSTPAPSTVERRGPAPTRDTPSAEGAGPRRSTRRLCRGLAAPLPSTSLPPWHEGCPATEPTPGRCTGKGDTFPSCKHSHHPASMRRRVCTASTRASSLSYMMPVKELGMYSSSVSVLHALRQSRRRGPNTLSVT